MRVPPPLAALHGARAEELGLSEDSLLSCENRITQCLFRLRGGKISQNDFVHGVMLSLLVNSLAAALSERLANVILSTCPRCSKLKTLESVIRTLVPALAHFAAFFFIYLCTGFVPSECAHCSTQRQHPPAYHPPAHHTPAHHTPAARTRLTCATDAEHANLFASCSGLCCGLRASSQRLQAMVTRVGANGMISRCLTLQPGAAARCAMRTSR